MMKELSFSLEEAVRYLPDAIRTPFSIGESLATLRVSGLRHHPSQRPRFRAGESKEHLGRRARDKGINSQWIDPDSGQRFEVQFHTRISFEAKQLTHSAYEPRPARSRPMRSKSLYWRHFREKLQQRFRFRQVPQTFPTNLRGKMTDKVTYYAIVNDLSSRERPAGVFRRIYFEVGGKRDEAFTTDLEWARSASLVSAERGDLLNEFIEISEDEANQIVARIRAEVTGTSSS